MNDIFNESSLHKLFLEPLARMPNDNIEDSDTEVCLFNVAAQYVQVLCFGTHIGNQEGVLPLGNPTETAYKTNEIKFREDLVCLHSTNEQSHEAISSL